MANVVIGKIVLNENVDQAKIDDLIAGTDTLIFEVERNFEFQGFPNVLSIVLPNQFDDVTIDYIDALKKVIDISLWQHIQNSLIFKIYYDSSTKEFNLMNSYVRDSKDTSGTLTAITTGQVLKARFSTPGLDETIYTDIDLPYNQSISTVDSDALKLIGITLNTGATGSLFTVINQKVPYKIEFYKPIAESLFYTIDFNYKNKKIDI